MYVLPYFSPTHMSLLPPPVHANSSCLFKEQFKDLQSPMNALQVCLQPLLWYLKEAAISQEDNFSSFFLIHDGNKARLKMLRGFSLTRLCGLTTEDNSLLETSEHRGVQVSSVINIAVPAFPLPPPSPVHDQAACRNELWIPLYFGQDNNISVVSLPAFPVFLFFGSATQSVITFQKKGIFCKEEVISSVLTSLLTASQLYDY